MSLRNFTLPIDADNSRPLFLRVADSFVHAIRTGRLPPGSKLPSSRELAKTLLLNRNTLLASFRELEAQGWITGAERSGTFVSENLPQEFTATGTPPIDQKRFELVEALGPLTESAPPGFFDLREGLPDLRLLSIDLLGRAYRRALVQRGGPLLQHPDPQGFLPFRRALSRLLADQRGTAFDPEHILVTRSPIASVDLVAKSLLRPGDAVAVENPGNPKVWDMLHRSGFRTIPIPVDREGLNVEALESVLDTQDIRLLHLTPFAQFPTTVSLSFKRRRSLLDLAHRRNIAILEDDSELGLGYAALPCPALAAQDDRGHVIYLSSFNRVIAPNLPLTFLAAPKPLTQQLTLLQARMDSQGDPILACALADLMLEGEVERHLFRLRKALLARRNALATGLRARMGENLIVEVPEGGTALWVEAKPGFDMRDWWTRCRHQGILFHSGSRWSHGKNELPGTRLGFSHLTSEELAEAALRLV